MNTSYVRQKLSQFCDALLIPHVLWITCEKASWKLTMWNLESDSKQNKANYNLLSLFQALTDFFMMLAVKWTNNGCPKQHKICMSIEILSNLILFFSLVMKGCKNAFSCTPGLCESGAYDHKQYEDCDVIKRLNVQMLQFKKHQKVSVKVITHAYHAYISP